MDDHAQSLRLDPGYASALIAQAEHVGTDGASAGSTADVNGASLKGVSLTDAAVASARAAVVAAQQGWEAVVVAASGTQAAGGASGVEQLSQAEARHAVQLGEVGQEEDSEPAVWI
ncbi:hypothetical protein [Mycobacterium haemophilum]